MIKPVFKRKKINKLDFKKIKRDSIASRKAEDGQIKTIGNSSQVFMTYPLTLFEFLHKCCKC